MAQDTRYVSAADTGKLIRATLKDRFPGIKFSVTTSTYSGGASCRIRWMDGPTAKSVDGAVYQYTGAHFDGMIDLKTDIYHEVNGQRVNYATDYIFTERSFSRDLVVCVQDRVCKEWGFDPLPIVGPSYYGSYSVQDDNSMDYHGQFMSVGRALRETVGR